MTQIHEKLGTLFVFFSCFLIFSHCILFYYFFFTVQKKIKMDPFKMNEKILNDVMAAQNFNKNEESHMHM